MSSLDTAAHGTTAKPVGAPQRLPPLGLKAAPGAMHRALAGASVLVPAVALRLWALNAVGFNSDEAVYAGQAASIAGNTTLAPFFPIFRAHPLLFQTILSFLYTDGVSDLAGRLLAVAFGVANVAIAYLLGKELYGRRAGYIAALLIAVMPYHVVVSRQVLLDGPMVFFGSVALYLLARYGASGRPTMLYGAAAALGLTVLTKETGIVLLGSAYAFLALTHARRLPLKQIAIALAIFGATILPFPVSVMLSGRTSTGGNFLVWQLFRRPNHSALFYAQVVPPSIGFLVLAAAAAGLVLLRRDLGWRELLLGSWIVVPVVLFVAWPVKGFQYLLPIATPLAVLAARALAALPATRRSSRLVPSARVAVPIVAITLALASVSSLITSARGTTFLAGSGGVPGGREAGEWVGSNVPKGATLLAVGPSIANIIEFYGDRKAYGLSVSTNPLHRNPIYEPVVNPDLLLRRSEIQYLVWDSYSAGRSAFFADRLLRLAERYHGRITHTEYVSVRTREGHSVKKPVIVIYEVRP